jgi:hypothetical protein
MRWKRDQNRYLRILEIRRLDNRDQVMRHKMRNMERKSEGVGKDGRMGP